MPSADKRQRKKENSRMAREAREAAAKRRRRLRTARNGAIAVAIFVGAIVLLNVINGGGSKKATPTTTTVSTVPKSTSSSGPTTTAVPRPHVTLTGFKADPAKTYTATIQTNLGTIVLALDAKNAPIAAGRFIELARAHFYDGLKWHRIVKDFVIQGGDPLGTGLGGSGNPPVKGEVSTNHYPVGALAAAKKPQDPDGTFDSQFFIVTGSQGATLANQYARFGTVTSGIDIAKKIEALPSDANQAPTAKATITSVTITEK